MTGESWEISTVAGDVSVVANGILKGKSWIRLVEMPAEFWDCPYTSNLATNSLVQVFGRA
jgi:hypothetical protein